MHLVCYNVYLCDWEGTHPATEYCNHVYVEQSCFNMGGDGGQTMGDSEPSIGHTNEGGSGGDGSSSTGNTSTDTPAQEVIIPPIKKSPVVPSESVENPATTPYDKLKLILVQHNT